MRSEYKGYEIEIEKQGIKWVVSVKPKGKLSSAEVPGQYDSEAEAKLAGHCFIMCVEHKGSSKKPKKKEI